MNSHQDTVTLVVKVASEVETSSPNSFESSEAAVLSRELLLSILAHFGVVVVANNARLEVNLTKF